MGEKDISEKLLADYEDVFADIVNVLLFHGIQRVHPESLQSSKTISHYKADDTKLHEQERDILKAWIDGGIQIALIGLEHQTEPEKQMTVRVIGYEGANYRSQLGQEPITPVITLVLYFGTEKHWNYPRNLKELMHIPHDKTTLKHVDAVLKLLAVMSGDHRYESILANSEPKGMVKTMDEALTKAINEEAARMRPQWIVEGQIKILVSLCRSGNISAEIAADQLNISTDEFRKYLEKDADTAEA